MRSASVNMMHGISVHRRPGMTAFAAAVVVTLVSVIGHAEARNGAPPVAGPSSYFILPGEALGFWGDHFLPRERIVLTDGRGRRATFTTDGNGSFVFPSAGKVPFSWAGAEKTFRFTGERMSRSYAFTVTVGRFYPQIAPSTYYVPVGSTFVVRGRGFAPGEPVELLVEGNRQATANADIGGNVMFRSATIPVSSNGECYLSARGLWSGEESARTVTVARE
ncbi:MAG: hypothetical protein PHW10_01245 [Candidatus Peribacteraceae bacterium]|nr:hypothetical protein [Candidatus Peribacteraceae bacterium]